VQYALDRPEEKGNQGKGGDRQRRKGRFAAGAERFINLLP